MKQTVNFRLNSQAIAALAMLEQKLHASKTAIVEKALAYYAKKKLTKNKLVLQYAGCLSDKEADELLATLTSDKHNKDIEIDL